MATTPGNVLVGTVDIYHKNFATGDDPVSATQVIDFSGWTQLGYKTKETGLTVTVSEEWFDFEVEEHNAAIDTNLIGEAVIVEFDLAESDALQFSGLLLGATYTVAAAAGTNPNTMGIGDKATPVLQSFAFAGKGPDSTDAQGLIWFFPKMRSDGDRAMTFHKGKDRFVKVRMMGLIDPARDAGERLVKVFEVTTA